MSYPNMKGIFVLLRCIVAFVSVIGVDITASLKNSSIAPRCGTSGYDYDVNYVPSVCTFYKIYVFYQSHILKCQHTQEICLHLYEALNFLTS